MQKVDEWLLKFDLFSKINHFHENTSQFQILIREPLRLCGKGSFLNSYVILLLNAIILTGPDIRGFYGPGRTLLCKKKMSVPDVQNFPQKNCEKNIQKSGKEHVKPYYACTIYHSNIKRNITIKRYIKESNPSCIIVNGNEQILKNLS